MKQNYEITIQAPRDKVWKAIVEQEYYRYWTKAFMESSFFEGGWNKGNKIHFLAIDENGNTSGMVSEIAESVFPEFISIKHIGFVKNGKIDTESEEVRKWAPSYENYTLTALNGQETHFKVELDIWSEKESEMFDDIWPKALVLLKEIAEKIGHPPIYPCLWFDGQGKNAADFYCSIFQGGKILQESPMVTTYEIMGTKLMHLDGGPAYKVNSAVSYFVYCGGEDEIVGLYKSLSEGGQILMPLAKYDWSPRYAWVIDRFGVNWQLDIDNIKVSQKIVPCLLFTNEKMGRVKAAITFYTEIFEDGKILMEAPYPSGSQIPEGTLLFAQFKLKGLVFNAISSTMEHDYDFSPGNSFVVSCQNQDEIDYYWNALGKEGEYDRCGWLTDKFGVSWQIVPAILPHLMADPEKAPKVIEAYLKMQKFDIQALLNA